MIFSADNSARRILAGNHVCVLNRYGKHPLYISENVQYTTLSFFQEEVWAALRLLVGLVLPSGQLRIALFYACLTSAFVSRIPVGVALLEINLTSVPSVKIF